MGNYPLIKFVILFSSGILLTGIVQGISPVLLILIFVLLLVALLIVLKANRKVLTNLILFTLVIYAGFCYCNIVSGKQASYPFNNARIKNVKLKGIVTEINLPKEKYFEFYLDAAKLFYKNSEFDLNHRFFCKVKKSKPAYERFSYSIGDTLIAVGAIQKARERRNPFEFDYFEYLSGKGVSGLFYIKGLKDVECRETNSFSFTNMIYGIRLGIVHSLENMYDGKTAALLKGLLLADRSSIDYETRESFINAGVIHVLAVSGLHVGYIALIFLFLFSRFNIVVKNVLTVTGLIFFVLITGAPPSVVRASIMAVIIIFYMFSIRQYNQFNALALAAFVILLFDPNQIFDAGFQLSFSAVLSIFIIYPIFQSFIGGWKINSKFTRGILLFISVSLAAQIGTLPFTIIYFHKFSIVALIANLFVIPLIGGILAIGIISLVVYPFIELIAAYYVSANELLCYLLFLIVDKIGKWEHSFLFIPQFSLYDLFVFYLSVAGLFVLKSHFRKRHAKLMLAFLIAANCYIFMKIDDQHLLPDNILSIVMIDIGQGDSFLIKFPNGKIAMVDAGNSTFGFDNGERVIKPLLQNLSIKTVDYGFVSHTDADHYKGYESLISRGMIDTVIKPSVDSAFNKDVRFGEFVKGSGTPMKYAERQILQMGNTSLYILTDERMFEENFHDLNEKSTVMKLLYGRVGILFTGDAGRKVERNYINLYRDFLKSDVLKAGHHGSKTSTSRNFLEAVDPKIALISCGPNNKFNHPSPETIELLEANKVKILRTDLHKAAILHTDGKRIWQTYWN